MSEDTSFVNMSQSEMQVAAKEAIIKALNNGSSLTEAKIETQRAVDQVASEQQKSMWASQNERVSAFRSYKQTVSEQEGLSGNDVLDCQGKM